MTATPDTADSAVTSINMIVHKFGWRGRVFLTPALLKTIRVGDLAADFERGFVEEDDEERLVLLETALAQRRVTVDVYPGESDPVEMHAYVRATSGEQLFACVLASRACVNHLVAMPPHIIFETATLQAVDDYSLASVTAGLEEWVRRVWPSLGVPEFQLRQHVSAETWPVMTAACSRCGKQTNTFDGLCAACSVRL